MERSIFMAWAAGLALMTWRELQLSPWRPPPPGRYLAASGLYALLGGVAAAVPAAAGPAAMVAWGFDLAVFLQVLPEQVGGRKTKAPAAQATAATTTATAGGRAR